MDVLLFVIGVAIIAVGLAVSIALHELGHLWPAKRFGVRVGQYMIGFGPTLWSRRRGETEYGVKLLPLGGYISMAGMYPPSPRAAASGRAGGGFFATMVQDARTANDETLDGAADDRVFYRLPIWKRIVIMLGGPFMNLVFAVVLFTLLFSGIGVQTATTTISSLSECVPEASVAAGEDLGCEPGDPVAPSVSAGLEVGDTIVSIDGASVSTFAEATTIIQASPGDELTLVIDRDGEQMTVQATPAVLSDGSAEVGFLGVRPTVEQVRQPLWAGPQAAFENVGAVAQIIVQLPVRIVETATSLVTGQERDPDGPLSIVGVGAIAGEVAASEAPVVNRVSAMVGLLASLNIALFVFNLIPLLPLDGGHVAVALWEGLRRWWAKVRGRPDPGPVDATKLVPVTFVVVIALIVMGGILILADIVNPISLLAP